jgi:peptide/nickel transport system permease protein
MIRRTTTLLAVLSVVALAGPWLAPYAPEVQHRRYLYAPPMPPRILHEGSLQPPFVYPVTRVDLLRGQFAEDRTQQQPLPWFAGEADAPAFLIGADSYGRDLLSRLLYGARVSLALALVSVVGAVLVGALFGGAAGYRGGWMDDVVMRLADLIAVLPVIYIVLVLRAALPLVLDPAIVFTLMAVIFISVGWPFVARGVRNIVTTEREREYVVAAQSLGASRARILGVHLLPACGGYLLVQATVLMPAFILAEATLSYVGLGFPDDVATWGTMLIEAANVNAMMRFPWTLAPAGAIFLVVLSANVVLQSGKIRRQLPIVRPQQ